MGTTYSELLKDPRWQKKRLEILDRDNFKCQSCGDSSRTLHVHHVLYKDDSLPWEYDNYDLIALCEICHEAWHYIEKHGTLGWETFILVARLYNDIEIKSIERFFQKQENNNE